MAASLGCEEKKAHSTITHSMDAVYLKVLHGLDHYGI